ncbi:heavy metal translocating P-type ATPase [Flavisolibacter tropicus]|nr:heavy metal translocating P-type ATPase metal-binding domain-containing protein [Flavisolibacter tropicus]
MNTQASFAANMATPGTLPLHRSKPLKAEVIHCFHCGETCTGQIEFDNYAFCCDGCQFVYKLLKDNDLCNYYDLSNTPGIKVKGNYAAEKFAYLDNQEVQQKLVRFTDGKQSHVSLSLPQMHCASCVWLLENLHVLQQGIIYSKVNFNNKEIVVAFELELTSLRKVIELLSYVGYEPYISLNDSEKKRPKSISRQQFYKIGVAGFCFSNIMMLSFPEYFSSGDIQQAFLKHLFTYLNLFLSLPVFFYSASDFFISACKGLKQKWLNIDAPIALSILITFSRSVYEVVSGTGAGYFDSMSGIVLFMLVGRWFQNKTYDAFSFDRDYKSYFPLGVTRIKEQREECIPINALEKGDRILVRSNEMIPADAIVINGEGNIDYSFVSGENLPVLKRPGELIYAGAKQLSGRIELEVVKPVSQSYITQLWNNNDIFREQKNKDKSFVHPWSRYFTAILFSITAIASVYWYVVDAHKVFYALTAALIVACPCSLLLSSSFTFGNMLRHFGKSKLYLKNASVIEALARINTVVFDKTGTLTFSAKAQIDFEGKPLSDEECSLLYSVVSQSVHPLSRLLTDYLLHQHPVQALTISQFAEKAGQGMEALVNETPIRVGSFAFVKGFRKERSTSATEVWIAIDSSVRGCFFIRNQYRNGVNEMVQKLEERSYDLHVLSGDNSAEKEALQQFFGQQIPLLFHQTPQDKLEYIKHLQQTSATKRVLMLGDGLNDAGSLQQSDVGIAVAENTSQFTPACDAILDSSKVGMLDAFLQYARSGKRVVSISFTLSILYNIVGLSFALQAKLSPMVAAILMPLSSITIVTFVTIATSIAARRNGVQ